jgi:glutamate/tyrosine decarboxylase-like PLP-dependent enzyme
VGALMTPAINGSVFTYEISPCYTLMENYLYEHMRKLMGWEKIDGTMTPGGSFANFMGLQMARFKAHPEANKKGLYGLKPMKIMTSEVSHYSIKKGMILVGGGTDNIVYVKADASGRMIASELEKAIKL